jgi:hypothetical protein
MLEAKKITNKFDSEKSLADELAVALALALMQIDGKVQIEDWSTSRGLIAKPREMRGN